MTASPSFYPAASRVAVVGGGPAGLMAAEVLAAGGVQVHLFDAMPSVGRKFLLAGKGGLNLTHGESMQAFVARFGSQSAMLEPMLSRFGPDEVRAWARGLGVETFVGSSGRVFPTDLKSAPLLRAWLHRLRAEGVSFHMRHRWTGFGDGDDLSLRFETPDGPLVFETDAVVLALGGGSWSRLGSDGAWVPLLADRGIDVAPLRPSNCGFDVGNTGVSRGGENLGVDAGWSEYFHARFAGQPLKNVALSATASNGTSFAQAGEFVITESGVEGSLVYAASSQIRDTIEAMGTCVVHIDLLPVRTLEFVRAEVLRPRGSRSLATHLKSRLGIDGVKAALLHELIPRSALADAEQLATSIKSLPLTLVAPRPIEEAISSAGGVRFEATGTGLSLKAMPRVFCAGEMLDWEAPTGGYLLTACLASGAVAGDGVLASLGRHAPSS